MKESDIGGTSRLEAGQLNYKIEDKSRADIKCDPIIALFFAMTVTLFEPKVNNSAHNLSILLKTQNGAVLDIHQEMVHDLYMKDTSAWEEVLGNANKLTRSLSSSLRAFC